MSSVYQRAILPALAVLALASTAAAQQRPYLGYVYPAGGQRGTTFALKIGGQYLDGVNGVTVSGKGVSGKVVEFFRKLGPQEITLLREQLDEFEKKVSKKNWELLNKAVAGQDAMMGSEIGMLSEEMMDRLNNGGRGESTPHIDVDSLGIDSTIVQYVTKIRTRLAEYVLRPASVSIASIVVVEITVSPDAEPGRRELRLVGSRGASNPMVFYVGALPEATRMPMLTNEQQVLGKEGLALRRLRDNGGERKVAVPCTLNGQIGSAEVHRYRFTAQKGQKLVLSTVARDLVPFIADAVPGWFQPVLTIYDAKGREVAYNDDFRFSPDPLIQFEVPKDGDYVVAINDSIFRGREDFVYRLTIDQSMLVTGVYPLGMQMGTTPKVEMKGVNLEGARLRLPSADADPGIHMIHAYKGGVESNAIPFAVDSLPECVEQEPNNDVAHAQKVELPINVNGRIDRPDDWDVFQFSGNAGETIIAEVKARRLNSPLDSVLKLTDAQGNVLAMNDDHDDPTTGGVNTHYADSYISITLPANGTYFLHLGDAARAGGEDFAYRLRISGSWPDFAVRVSPSSALLRGGNASVNVYVDRRDGFSEPITVTLKDPPQGISASSATLSGDELMTKISLHADNSAKHGPVRLVFQGTAKVGVDDVVHVAVAAEDRMQAFLWRHLAPAEDFMAYVYDAAIDDKPRRAKPSMAGAKPSAAKGTFSKAQVAGRLRQLENLFGDGLLTPEFYRDRVAECEAAK